MNSRGENILLKNAESILILLVLFFALLTYSNADRTGEKTGCSPSISSSLNKSDAISTSGLSVFFYGKSLITILVDMRLLNLHKDPELENRIADIKITISRDIRRKLDQSPPSAFTYHLFPVENEELPVLS